MDEPTDLQSTLIAESCDRLLEKHEVITRAKTKVVIVMRSDLNMRKGKMVAQGGHAIQLLMEQIIDKPIYAYWKEDNIRKICVQCPSEKELLETLGEAQLKGFPTSRVIDSGTTEFDGVPTLTCIAIGPATDEELAPLTGDFKLF